MRLDRYTGKQHKFRVFRRADDGPIAGTYSEVPASDYFVLALKDVLTPGALREYAAGARLRGDAELADDVERLAVEAEQRPDRKMPD